MMVRKRSMPLRLSCQAWGSLPTSSGWICFSVFKYCVTSLLSVCAFSGVQIVGMPACTINTSKLGS